MITALVRALDVPYQVGRMAADLEFQMLKNGIEAKGFDLDLQRKVRRIDLREWNYNPLQQAEFEAAKAQRQKELKPQIDELYIAARPYWETHDYLVNEHAPNIHEVVMLSGVPQEMLKRYPGHSPIPRQEEFYFSQK